MEIPAKMGYVFYSQNSRYIRLIAAAILGKSWLVQELLVTGSAAFELLIARPA